MGRHSACVSIYACIDLKNEHGKMINHHVVGSYDDLWGPAVLCVLLMGALIVKFYLRFR
ncbi:hypothetical protein BCR42DRAFT_436140 [Absidia repens]|uniref:Uncharacterized protein n=1 Tax=Absidia repens TaxID=90262 RepID=A0A1X2IM08_9FUNG|nr:hypothetical protein BCR42DRAFT_436140 [Absidia repens]